MNLRFPRANIPEGGARAGMFSQPGAAAATPKPFARARIDIAEQVFVRRATMLIETQVHAASARAHVARSAMIDRDIVNKPRSKIEIDEQIVAPFKIKSMM